MVRVNISSDNRGEGKSLAAICLFNSYARGQAYIVTRNVSTKSNYGRWLMAHDISKFVIPESDVEDRLRGVAPKTVVIYDCQ